MPRRTRLRSVATIMSVVVCAGFGTVSFLSFRSAVSWAEHAMEVQRTAARWLGAELDAQTSARGFVMSQRPDLLGASEEADAIAKRMPEEIRALIADNPLQMSNVDDAEQSAHEAQNTVHELIALVKGGRRDAAIARLSTGAPFDITTFREALRRINAEEDRVLKDRLDSQRRLETLSLSGLVIFTCVAGGLAFSSLRARRLAARAEEEAESMRETLLEAAPDAIVVASENGDVVYVNARAADLFGYDRTEMVGRRVEMLLPERHRDNHPDHRVGNFAPTRGRPMGAPSLDLRARCKDGSEFPAEISLAPVTIGGVTFTMTAVRDATVREQAEADRVARHDAERAAEQARQALRTQETFVAVLGHDLRHPLASVKLTLELLRRRGLSVDSATAAERAARSVHRMERMILQILDFARARLGGGIPVERRQTCLADIVGQVVDEARAGHPDGVIDLSVEGDTAGCWDRDRLAQVASNLIGNALTHGTQDSPVRIVLRSTDTDVFFEVSNAGEVPPEVRGTLFDPFRRGHRPLSGGAAGLGLGLFIAQQVVSEHGGKIGLESSNGETTFRMKLPRRYDACEERAS